MAVALFAPHRVHHGAVDIPILKNLNICQKTGSDDAPFVMYIVGANILRVKDSALAPIRLVGFPGGPSFSRLVVWMGGVVGVLCCSQIIVTPAVGASARPPKETIPTDAVGAAGAGNFKQ